MATKSDFVMGNAGSNTVIVLLDNEQPFAIASFAVRVEVSEAGTLRFERLFISMSVHDDETGGAWARVKKDGTFQMLGVPDGSFAFSVSCLERAGT